jgi:hypothetical protein
MATNGVSDEPTGIAVGGGGERRHKMKAGKKHPSDVLPIVYGVA